MKFPFVLSSLKKIPACDSKNIQWITPQILISTETVNLESTYDESWGLSSELGDFKPGISPSSLALKYYICFCTGFSCTPHPGDIQCLSLCLLFIFALRVTFKWNFHIGSSLTKKTSYTLRKKLPYFLSQYSCWLFEEVGDLKGLCQVLFAPKFRLYSWVNKTFRKKSPKFSEIFLWFDKN